MTDQEVEKIKTVLELAIYHIRKHKITLHGERYLSVDDLAEVLKISPRTQVKYRQLGLLPFYRFGGKILYKESEIVNLLNHNRSDVSFGCLK